MMKEQLKTLLPVLKHFTVRVDENGREVTEPRYYTDYIKDTEWFNRNPPSGKSKSTERIEAARQECISYHKATEVIRLPRVMDFVETAYSLEEYELRHSDYEQLKQYTDFAKLKPQLSNYITCDEDGNVLVEPDNWGFYLEKSPNWHNDALIQEPFKDWIKQCRAYQAAKEKVVFENWRLVASGKTLIDGTPQDYVSIINENEHFTFTKNGDCFTSYNGGGLTKVEDNDEAFKKSPHYIKLDETK